MERKEFDKYLQSFVFTGIDIDNKKAKRFKPAFAELLKTKYFDIADVVKEIESNFFAMSKEKLLPYLKTLVNDLYNADGLFQSERLQKIIHRYSVGEDLKTDYENYIIELKLSFDGLITKLHSMAFQFGLNFTGLQIENERILKPRIDRDGLDYYGYAYHKQKGELLELQKYQNKKELQQSKSVEQIAIEKVRVKIPMDKTVSVPVKALAHLYSSNLVSIDNAAEIIAENGYQNKFGEPIDDRSFYNKYAGIKKSIDDAKAERNSNPEKWFEKSQEFISLKKYFDKAKIFVKNTEKFNADYRFLFSKKG